ncbi:hypothetical protein HDF16_005444 [Granulicella aggregans]|uniref:Type IV secretion system coupling protein TraD DNA-binding domain-containing protein n=1 Tax=Granulicella aggregans TaxID=474949 RepID=A0A7W8E606_9BACT|nr:type IV secretion system DNA-binding domain-containing protein [Granulicella aggregans]MBB5060708.1 hypothetical protein [Granulicella aggregans]
MFFPIWIAVGLICFFVPYALWFSFALTPLQKQYFNSYLMIPRGHSTGAGRRAKAQVWWVSKTAPKRKPEIAVESDVVADPVSKNPALPLNPSPKAQAAGWTGLILARQVVSADGLEKVLREGFFGDESLSRLLLTPVLFGAALFVTVLLIRNRIRSRSSHEDRHGRRTKGPELISDLGSNKAERDGGIKLRLKPTFGILPSSFAIPRRLESSHILLMGDTGSGKSNAIRQILREIQKRGEAAIVNDPAGEFVQEFYNPERGDFVLNPLDERCPSWNLPNEVYDYGTSDAIAAAMLPEKEHEKAFFTDAPRRVLSRLLKSRPSVQELLEWMADPTEIERRLEGTPQAAYLDRNAGPQRGGVLASLNMIADSLALLPEQDEKRGFFETTQWGFKRTQWVFLTSKPTMRDRVLPLHSAWLDLLILRMMEPCANPSKPVWFVLDELASLNKLPQLHTAVTENRKYGIPIVLGFQGRSQLEKRYGQDAEAMLSQPATKIFFKTSEPRAAKWISETLGEIEVERLKESRTPQLFRSKKTFAVEIATKPLVMASEIAGLEPLNGYIKLGNGVMPVRFALTPLRKLQAEFIARKMTVPEPRSVPPPVPEIPLKSPQPDAASTHEVADPQGVAPDPPPVTPEAPLTKAKQPKRPKSPFERKDGTANGTAPDWNESHWID